MKWSTTIPITSLLATPAVQASFTFSTGGKSIVLAGKPTARIHPVSI